MRHPVVVAFALALLATPAADPIGARDEGGPASITAEELRRHVVHLAGDAMRGRDTGSDDIRRAEDYVAKAFAAAGLTSMPGQDDMFLDFVLHRDGFDAESTRVAISAGGAPRELALGVDYRPFDFSAQGTVEGSLVFAGYGITSTEHGWDDYEDLDVRGKVVLVLRHEPCEKDPKSPFDGAESSRHSNFTTKFANAAEHGAIGFVLVTDPLNHEEADDLRVAGSLKLPPLEDAEGSPEPVPTRPPLPSAPPADIEVAVERPAQTSAAVPAPQDVQHGSAPATPTSAPPGPRGSELLRETKLIPAIQVSRAVAERLVASTGRSLTEIQRAVDAGTPASAFRIGATSTAISVKKRPEPEEVRARNVAGYLQGSDPALRDELVVVGGHHDHVGAYTGAGDTIFNGADDNASGVSGVLELAQAFAGAAQRPRRSMVFATFSGEEKGLLGSRWLVERGPLDTERVAFMFNFDMIGRNPERPIEVIGDGFVSGLRDVVKAANSRGALDLEFGGDEYFGNSDHDPFYRRDIPFTFFFTGLHADYHQLGDHVEKLDFARMEKILRVAHDILRSIADADRRPRFIHHVTWLGASVEVEERPAGPAAVVTSVVAGSRGAKAGLRAGDELRAFDDETLDDPRRDGKGFRDITPGSRAVLHVRRGAGHAAIAIERAKPGYLGVFPGQPEADVRKTLGLREDEGLLLRSVTEGGPAAKAGLRDGDVVLSVNGTPVTQRSLTGVLAQLGAGEVVDVVYVRAGDRRTAAVTLEERPRQP